MFTGLVQELGVVRSHAIRGGYGRLEVSYGEEKGVLRPGDSMAVNGVCLTATVVTPGFFSADVSEETRRSSTTGSLRAGKKVNLERPLTPVDPMGGHIVLGHVDGIGTVRRITPAAGGFRLTIAAPSTILRYLVDKGSVAIDGISLTIAAVASGSFDLFLIPETLERTTLGEARPGAEVNIEVDYLAKLVQRFLMDKYDPADRFSSQGRGED